MKTIREYLKSDILIFDGSMGTYFASKYKTRAARCENINITDPSKILAIHREYIEAGCRAIKTNTFAANIDTMEGDKTLLGDILKAGYNVALGAAGDEAYVFADIGFIEASEEEDITEKYKLNAELFLQCGAKNFLFETLVNDAGIYETAKYIKEKCPDSFIMTSFAVHPDGYTRDGSLGYELLSNADKCAFVDVVGLNCVSGPHHMYSYYRKLKNIKKYKSVMPNAGYPRVINNRTFFEDSPEYFADKMAQMAAAGAKIIGGCCGTTPKHIALTVSRLSGELQVEKEEAGEELEQSQRPSYIPQFNKKLNAGEKVIAVELDSPEDADIKKFLKNVLLLKNAGIDIMTIADCPIAKARVDSSLLACKLKREFDLDVLPHITCRDRNINATKALLLGLNIDEIRNILIVTGDPIPSAQRDEVKSVFNFNSRRLARYVSTLNDTIFQEKFSIFGALNVNAKNFDFQLKLAKEKEQNGMCGFLTQPVMTEASIENLKKAHENLEGKILAGIMPIMSYRNACFMENEISGINVPPEIIEAFEDKTKEESVELGIKIATEKAEAIKDFCDGYYLITPFARADVICRIIENLTEKTNS